MRRIGRWLGRALLLCAAAGAGAWVLVPRTGVGPVPQFEAAGLDADPDGWLAAREAVFDDIVPGTRKRILWAGAPGVRTPVALVYLHGFSATSEEIRPVPDQVAAALGANLYFARLAGHGRDGAALASARADDWMLDLAEAVAVGTRIGERLVIVGTSTGGTLAALAATDPDLSARIAGVILVSPNFGLANGVAQVLLDAPLVERWGPAVVGRERSFAVRNDDHARFWTERYPTAALMPMAALVRAVRARGPGRATVPALFVYSPDDAIVSVARMAAVVDGWGAPAETLVLTAGPGDDPNSHVLAGDILSPGLTGPVTSAMTGWIRATLALTARAGTGALPAGAGTGADGG